jgi:hypothetical protein
MGQRDYPETPVRNYHYTLRNNPEEHRSHLLIDRSLKSREVMSTFRICCFGDVTSHICPQMFSRGTVIFRQLDRRVPLLKSSTSSFSKFTEIGGFRWNILNNAFSRNPLHTTVSIIQHGITLYTRTHFGWWHNEQFSWCSAQCKSSRCFANRKKFWNRWCSVLYGVCNSKSLKLFWFKYKDSFPTSRVIQCSSIRKISRSVMYSKYRM